MQTLSQRFSTIVQAAARVDRRGMTLVELMIVVAIVGVLAAIGGMSYSKYIRQGKVTQLKQYAMDVARGQEQFRARNNRYYQPDSDYAWDMADADRPEWNNLLEFNSNVAQGITIIVEADIGGNCTICPAGAEPQGVGADNNPWFAVLVTQEELGGDAFQAFFTNDMPAPMELIP
ncbi:prepilin-type N-terminal cleavage/methylation domain-containing protein [Bradymonadaceae bacterium TMQ3]|nr:prepilin-type N-terminal cleavage/methylation domain-containing protein [Bradymonadaceae bacterium TMQ3]TXC76713.1 prepilin-type N-terminal cleavage/methylation domain-containing protein [Bradymonadales bacterium TMQ1]